MKLQEILNTTKERTPLLPNSYGAIASSFKDPAGTKITVEFNQTAPDAYDISFDRDGAFNMTGEGDALEIFSTVVDAVKDFVKQENPDTLSFSAKTEEGGRVKFYKRLASRLASKLGFRVVEPEAVDIDTRRFYSRDDTPFYLKKMGT